MELIDSGTLAMTDGGSYVVTTIAIPGIYVFMRDFSNNMQSATDIYTTSIALNILSGGTEQNSVVYVDDWNYLSSVVQSLPFIVGDTATITVDAQCPDGPQNLPWRLVKLNGLVSVATGTVTANSNTTINGFTTASTAGIYVVQYDFGVDSYGAGGVGISVSCSDPTGGELLSQDYYNDPPASPHWQSDPIICLDTITLNMYNMTTAQKSFPWSLIRVS